MKATLFTKKRIEVKESRVEGVLNYDLDNAYSNRVIDIINNSVTGVACVNLFSKFIQGKGFKDQAFFKLVVNSSGLTNDKFLRKLADGWGSNGFAVIHVNYNALYEAVEFTPVPPQYARLTPPSNEQYPNRVIVYDNWDKRKSSRIKKEDFQYFRHFNPDPAVIQAEVEADGGWDKYNGQIWFVSKEGANYVLAPCDSVLEDMQTEGHAKIFKYRNITTNFLASHFLITDKKENSGIERGAEISGDPASGEAGELRRRQSREDSQQQEAFVQSLVDFQGADDALKIALIEKDSPDQTFQLQKVEIQDIEDLYSFTETSVRDNIIRCFLQPQILVGVQTAGKLGTSKEIKDATDFYNSVTEGERIVFEEIFKKLFSIWHVPNVNATGDYSIIPINAFQSADNVPTELLKDMTVNERRSLLGLSDLQDNTGEKKKLIETLGVGSVTAVIAILTDPVLTIEQKKGTMITFGFSEEEAKTMLNITEPPTA